MSEPTPNNNSAIQLARDFDAEKMRRERELLKQLVESQKLLSDMKLEYTNFLKQNPEIAIDIDQYFQNKKCLSQTEQNLEEDLENLKNENKSLEEIEKQQEIQDFEKIITQIPKVKAMDLQIQRKQLLQLFKTENYQKEGLTMQQAEEIKSEFNTLWNTAITTGNYFEVEQFLSLVLEKGLKAGFAEYKKVNKLELMQRQIAQNNWEAFFIADFLKLFDKFTLPKGANKNVWLKWVQTQETKSSHQKQADLSEQINEQKITNQESFERQKVEEFRGNLIKLESKNQEITFQDIPQTWEEFGLKYDKFLEKYEIWEKLAKAEIQTEKFNPNRESKNGILLRFSEIFSKLKFKEIYLNGLKVKQNNHDTKIRNLRFDRFFINIDPNFIDEAFMDYKNSYKFTSSVSKVSFPEKIKNLTTAYLELGEFFAKFGLEF